MRRLALLLLAASWPSAASAAFSRGFVGTGAGSFLKLPIDARGAALGGAMGAAADDASALHWNPADLAGVGSSQIMASYLPYIEGINYGFVGFVHPLESLVSRPHRELAPTGLGTVAVGAVYLSAGSLKETDNTGASTGGSFTPTDIAVMAGWGGAMTRSLDLGITLKGIRSQVRDSATTVAGDFGARLRLRAGPVPYALSASAHNSYGHLKYQDQQAPLPLTLRFGADAELLPGWLVLLGADAARDNAPFVSAGTEFSYTIQDKLGLAGRLGYNGLNTRGQLEGTAGLCMGGGVRWDRFNLDYAFEPYGAFGDVHRVTLLYRW
jgi:hypothetical protein